MEERVLVVCCPNDSSQKWKEFDKYKSLPKLLKDIIYFQFCKKNLVNNANIWWRNI